MSYRAIILVTPIIILDVFWDDFYIGQGVFKWFIIICVYYQVVRCVGNHGLDVRLLIQLARIFSDRANSLTKQSEIDANNSRYIFSLNTFSSYRWTAIFPFRAELYWKTALPLLEKLKNNHAVIYPKQSLFTYKNNKELTQDEVSNSIEKAKLFLGVQLMKKKEHEKAMHIFEQLKDPYASFYQSQIYKTMADSKTNQNKENVTSEMRSQNVILLSRYYFWHDCS